MLSVAFSPDGKQIASGGMDRTIKIWNVADGTVAKELTNPAFKPAVTPTTSTRRIRAGCTALRWVDGGKKLVSAGQAPRLQRLPGDVGPGDGQAAVGQGAGARQRLRAGGVGGREVHRAGHGRLGAHAARS